MFGADRNEVRQEIGMRDRYCKKSQVVVRACDRDRAAGQERIQNKAARMGPDCQVGLGGKESANQR